MSYFAKLHFSHRVDDEILELYIDIETEIEKTDKILLRYFKYLRETNYYKSNVKNRRTHSIETVHFLLNKLKGDYTNCYELRENRKHYNFNKSAQTRADKMKIVDQLKTIKLFIENMYAEVSGLSQIDIKGNSSEEYLKNLGRQLEEIEEKAKKAEEVSRILNVIKKEDEHVVFSIINKIVAEAAENERNNIHLIDQYTKTEKLLFSQNLTIKEIRYLEFVPILDLKGLEKRSLFINALHKDRTLDVFHYNLIINGKNIHVVPRGFKDKLEPFLSAA